LNEARKWVRQATQDLHVAEACAPAVPAPALFHCQQAAEKLLKALFLTWNQTPFRKTHE
jgi:HEPN domain-containing protein